ncbi:MAG: M28 family peptidase [Planctomycetota bacterium]
MPRSCRTLIFLALLTSVLAAQEAIDGEAALATVRILAGKDFEGRKSGLPGGTRAEAWMADRVREAGLAPLPGGTHFHEFKASVTAAGDKPLLALGDDPAASYLDDYVTLLYSGAGEIDAPVVLAGWGIHAPKKGYSDYDGLDVKGKIVIAVRGKPDDPRFDEERYIGYKSSTAFDQGAAGFILVEGVKAVPGTIQEKYYREKLPAIWAAGKYADALFARGKAPTLKEIKAKLNGGEKVSMALDGVRCKLRITARLLKDRPMRNVVGVWNGDGSSDEWIVVGAHLDHVGIDATGNLYPGADDNASGSSMLLEVARAVAARGERFRRNILFIWFAGEEQGLLGSWQFVRKPPVPLEKIAVMINTDMVGQGKPRLNVAGGDVYPRDAAWLGGLNVGVIPWKPTRSGSRSDHYPFQSSGVPAFFVSTQGKHENYHQPGDVPDNIKADLLGTAATYVRAMTVRAAQSEHAHVRPFRREEYVCWSRATTVDTRSGEAPDGTIGVDLRIEWQDGDWSEIARALVKSHRTGKEKSADETVLVAGSAPGPLLRDVRPTRLLGVKGADAVRFARDAHKVGALCFAPFAGKNPNEGAAGFRALNDLAKDHPIVVDLWGADPETLPVEAVAQLDAPILLVPIGGWKSWKPALVRRKQPWFAVYALRPATENKPATWLEIAKDIEQRVAAGGVPLHRLLIVPGPAEDAAWQAQAPTLIPGLVAALLELGFEDRAVRRMVGSGFANVVAQRLKPPRKAG